MEITSVIIKPLLTEKSQLMKNSSSPKMVFLVNIDANKSQIAQAFFLLFGMRPSKINIIVRKPSPTRITKYSRNNYTKLFKIAYVTLSSQDLEKMQAQLPSASESPSPTEELDTPKVEE